MSRLLNALRNLHQSPPADDAAPSQKVTPRVAASIRKAVLGNIAAPSAIEKAQILFRVPSAEIMEAPTPPKPRIQPPDPVHLVEAIQASISSVQHDALSVQHDASSVQYDAPAEEAVLSGESRSRPTPAELELRALLDNSAHSRPYRDLLETVQRDVASKASPVVAIVGLNEQDSTAHVAAALGFLVADREEKGVLLIEANPARRLSERYGLSHASGLTETLAGRTARVIAATSHPQLDLLPFGQATDAQAQLLPQVLAAEVAQLQSARGLVVIDAGPLSGAWGLAASQAADATYLVVRMGDTSAEFASACVQRFRAAGGRLTGCIAVGAINA